MRLSDMTLGEMQKIYNDDNNRCVFLASKKYNEIIAYRWRFHASFILTKVEDFFTTREEAEAHLEELRGK